MQTVCITSKTNNKQGFVTRIGQDDKPTHTKKRCTHWSFGGCSDILEKTQTLAQYQNPHITVQTVNDFSWEPHGGRRQTCAVLGPASSSAAEHAPLCWACWSESENGKAHRGHWRRAAGPVTKQCNVITMLLLYTTFFFFFQQKYQHFQLKFNLVFIKM